MRSDSDFSLSISRAAVPISMASSGIWYGRYDEEREREREREGGREGEVMSMMVSVRVRGSECSRDDGV